MTYRGRIERLGNHVKEERKETLERMEFLNADGEAGRLPCGDYLVGEVETLARVYKS